MKDQWDCVLNDPEELGDKEFLTWWISTILKSFLVTSASCHFYSSAFHQTNVESAQNCAEDNPLISRIQSLHLLLEVDHHDEEEYSVVLTLGKRYANIVATKSITEIIKRAHFCWSLRQIFRALWQAKKCSCSKSIQDLSPIRAVLVDEQAGVRLGGLL